MNKRMFLSLIFLLSAASWASCSDDLMELGDRYYMNRADLSSAEASAHFFRQAVLSGTPSYEPSWRAARSWAYLADAGSDPEPYLVSGEEWAKVALLSSPEGWEGNYWYGVIMERFGGIRNPFLRIAIDEEVERRMLKVASAEPEFDGAHRELATIYRRTVGYPVSIGNIEKAKDEAKLAVKLAPNNAWNHLVLGHVYSDLWEGTKAKEHLALALKIASSSEATPEDLIAGKKAAELELRVPKDGSQNSGCLSQTFR